ncbi:hypothetical protein [Sinomonas sp. G460-2]|uniref:8-oxoguanine DNA glycosylase OGG fold protein n=1 Tax=Sinomonas sp. G460-2 TaxID=3393464 RepID=UPI0039EE9788
MTTTVPEALANALSAPYRPQESFRWSRNPWTERMHDLPDVLNMLDALPERIDRQFVAETVSAEIEAGRVLPGFVATMVWGWGDKGGRGAVRTRWILTGVKGPGDEVASIPVDPSVADRLQRGPRAVRGLGAVRGFREMNTDARIKHFGSSYFTKWLYFASAASGVEGASAAPILDDQIIKWLGHEAGIWFRSGSTKAYSAYLELLKGWGDRYDRTPVQVETEMFRLATGRG